MRTSWMFLFYLEKRMPINNIDEERFVAVLKEAINKVKTEEDPVALTEMKKLFKKHVPFSLRNYVAAYLAKQSCQGFKGGSKFQGRQEGYRGGSNRVERKERSATQRRQEDFRRDSSAEASTEPRPSPRRVTIDEEHAATLFIGIGKNRRVYTRDLITLLMQVCKLDRERIGRIRNQENYSFVELFKDDVDDVIATLNGYSYHGRNLTVSYARKKEEGFSSQDDVQQDEGLVDSAEAGTAQDESAETNQE